MLEAAGTAALRVRQGYPTGLSDREVEVLRLLAQGRTNREIAQALVITEKTANHRVERIYAKAGVSTRVGAAPFAWIVAWAKDGPFTRCRGPARRVPSRPSKPRRTTMTEVTATDVPVAGTRGGHFIEVNGATLYYEDRGAGTPLILIHGGLASSAMWEQLLPSLLDGFRVITPDSRGHGRSTNPSGVLSYTQLADDVAALIAALGLVLPVVGGYSDGGQVVLELGARHPDAAGALIVGAAYPDFAASGLREVWKAFLGADDAGTPDLAQVDATLGDLADHVKSLHPGGEQQWKTLVLQSAPMWLDYQGLTPDDVRRIEAPALVVTGDRDDMIPLDRMVSLYRTLPNAELAVCPRADHFALVAQERTVGMFAEMIREFAGRHGKER